MFNMFNTQCILCCGKGTWVSANFEGQEIYVALANLQLSICSLARKQCSFPLWLCFSHGSVDQVLATEWEKHHPVLKAQWCFNELNITIWCDSFCADLPQELYLSA